MAASTNYFLPKWAVKTPIMDVLEHILDPKNNPETEFHNEFSTYRDGGLPHFHAELHRGEAAEFDLLLQAMLLTFERGSGSDFDRDVGVGEGSQYLAGENINNYNGDAADDVNISLSDLLNLIDGKNPAGLAEYREKLHIQNHFKETMNAEEVPEGFSFAQATLNVLLSQDSDLSRKFFNKAVELIDCSETVEVGGVSASFEQHARDCITVYKLEGYTWPSSDKPSMKMKF